MVKAHVGDSVIIGQIENSSTRYTLTADQIIGLKNVGVSEGVINALINTASKMPPQTTATTMVQGPYAYPYPYPYAYPYPNVYINPWPMVWWGWGPGFHGYYRWR